MSNKIKLCFDKKADEYCPQLFPNLKSVGETYSRLMQTQCKELEHH